MMANEQTLRAVLRDRRQMAGGQYARPVLCDGHEQASQWNAIRAVDMTKEQISESQKLSREMTKANPKLMGD